MGPHQLRGNSIFKQMRHHKDHFMLIGNSIVAQVHINISDMYIAPEQACLSLYIMVTWTGNRTIVVMWNYQPYNSRKHLRVTIYFISQYHNAMFKSYF